jgi:hypothetical protein
MLERKVHSAIRKKDRGLSELCRVNMFFELFLTDVLDGVLKAPRLQSFLFQILIEMETPRTLLYIGT